MHMCNVLAVLVTHIAGWRALIPTIPDDPRYYVKVTRGDHSDHVSNTSYTGGFYVVHVSSFLVDISPISPLFFLFPISKVEENGVWGSLLNLITWWDTLCRCPLSGLFWFARQWILLARQRSLLSILFTKYQADLRCLAIQNKPDNGQRHRVSHPV